MSDLKKKEAAAIAALKTFEPEEGYYLCYSGGKDSNVIWGQQLFEGFDLLDV